MMVLWIALVLLAVIAAGMGGMWYSNRKAVALQAPETPRPAAPAARLAQRQEVAARAACEGAGASRALLVPANTSPRSIISPWGRPGRPGRPGQPVGPDHMRCYPETRTGRASTVTDPYAIFNQRTKFHKRDRTALVFVTQEDYNATTGVLTVPLDFKNTVSFELFEACVPRAHYAVASPYNTFTIHSADDNAGTTPVAYDIVLVEGNYTASELQVQIAAQLTAGSVPATVTVDAKTQKFTFAVTTKYLALEFDDQNLAYILGFGTSSLYYPTRTVVATVVYGFSAGPALADLVSPYLYDINGSRYMQLEATALKKSYSNSKVVSKLPFANDITYISNISQMVRVFIAPRRLRNLSVDLKVLMPDGTNQIFNNKHLAFSMTFAVRTDIMTIDRTDQLAVE
jgi:hypothetical protein